MRTLHLFAGIGGGMLADEMLGHTPVCAVEINPYCRDVLARHWPGLPLHDDIRTFDTRPWRGRVDLVAGGFPCQPFSSAGKRQREADPRHLWPEMARVVAECRPRYVFAENVAIDAFREPHRDLRAMGYRVAPALCLSAADVGAPHLRARWWLLATHPDADSWRLEGEREPQSGGQQGAQGSEPYRLCPVGEQHDAATGRAATQRGWWSAEPGLGGATDGRSPWLDGSWEQGIARVAPGVPKRVDRLKALGNAQVPATAALALATLLAQ